MKSARSLPLYAVFVLLAVSAALLPFHARLERRWPTLWNGGVAELYGFAPVTVPTFTPQRWLDGKFQAEAEAWAGRMLPARALWVRSFDQVLFSVLKVSYSNHDTIVVGRDRQLFEVGYLKAYCGDPPGEDATVLDLWAQKLRQMQDWFAARGQVFIFVITPSKASFFPQKLPADYRCRPVLPAPAYQHLVAALTKYGVRYVDGHRTTQQAEIDSHGALPLFVQGGTHWTYVAAAFCVQQLVALYNEMSPGPKFGPFAFAAKPTNGATGADVDLFSLLNLLWSDLRQRYADIAFTGVAGGDHPKVAIIGGSFCVQLLQALSVSGETDKIRFLFYWTFEKIDIDGTASTASKIDGEQDYQPILTAPLVILEENESIVHSAHGQRLAEFIAAQH